MQDPQGVLGGGMLWALLGLHWIYVICCLDDGRAQSSVHTSKGLKSGTNSTSTIGLAVKRSQTALIALIFAVAMTPVLFAVIVLFGAPITSLVSKTSLLALHISLLSLWPLVYTHHADSNKWFLIITVQLPLDELYTSALGTWIGAYLGAIPIPLDWDRDWQQWPITIITGAYLGFAVGKTVGSACEYFERREASKVKKS